jgi:ornithine cyclodeaminase/alanine dehydrogenase-like protein (mu-crystallin family)
MGQPALLLSQDDVKSLLDMPTVLDIVSKVYRAHGEGTVLLPPKLTLDLAAAVPPPCRVPDGHAGLPGRPSRGRAQVGGRVQ